MKTGFFFILILSFNDFVISKIRRFTKNIYTREYTIYLQTYRLRKKTTKYHHHRIILSRQWQSHETLEQQLANNFENICISVFFF